MTLTNLEAFAAVAARHGWAAGLEAIGINPRGMRRGQSEEGRAIIAAVAVAFDIPPSAILSASRHRTVVQARWDAMQRMRYLGWSLPRVGRELGRHHTTVLHALRQMKP